MLSSLGSDVEFLRTWFPIATMFAAAAHANQLKTSDYDRPDYMCSRNSCDSSTPFGCNTLVDHFHRMYLSLPFVHWRQHSRTLVYIAIVWKKMLIYLSVAMETFDLTFGPIANKKEILNIFIFDGICVGIIVTFEWSNRIEFYSKKYDNTIISSCAKMNPHEKLNV